MPATPILDFPVKAGDLASCILAVLFLYPFWDLISVMFILPLSCKRPMTPPVPSLATHLCLSVQLVGVPQVSFHILKTNLNMIYYVSVDIGCKLHLLALLVICSLSCRDYLVDYVAGRYAEPYQSAYRTDQVLQQPLKVAQGQGEWDTTGLPQALREYPPTVTAAGWMAQVAPLSVFLPPLIL